MDSKRVLLFLDFLIRESSGHSEIIASLYKHALDEDDIVACLKRDLNDYSFYGEIGKSYYENGKKLLERIYSMPSQSPSILPMLKQVHETIEDEARNSRDMMCSPVPFSETLSVIKNSDTIAYMNALRMIAGSCVYLMTLYEGVESLRNLSWNDAVGIQEMIYAVNTKFIPSLCNVKQPDYSWVIQRKRFGGKFIFPGDWFCLDYKETKQVEVLCGALRKEPIGTHAFLNIDAYEAGEYDVPLCWGIGNIVSVTPESALQLLQSEIVTKVRSPHKAELEKRMPTPLECVKQLADGKLFCISPDELLITMNQWQQGYEIEVNKRANRCLFCGKPLDENTLVCTSHFIRS